jgi:hypothetical protein
MDRQMLNRQFHLHVVGNFRFQHLLDVVNLVELQNLDELNLDEDLTCQVAEHLLHRLVVPVDADLRHLKRMDYFQVAVDVELRHLKRMDYFQVAVLELLALAQPEFLIQNELNLFQERLVARYCFRQSRALAQPLAQLNQRRVLRPIQQLTLDLLRPFWQRSSLRQPF